MGKIGRIDLSGGSITEYSIPERAQYPGGKILNQRILLDLLTGTESAFSEETPIILSTGPLTGTGAPGSLRFDIASLSPKDDCPVFSNCGGSFGLQLKKAGYDALILTGRCPEKCWLEICEDGIRFHDARQLWGSRVSDCRTLLEKALNCNGMGTLCIGPAGENLIKFASVMADGHSTGRAGIGAVMGWKNLKAIAVWGENTIPIRNPEGVAALNADWYAMLKQQGQKAENPEGKTFCTGCPLHCVRHEREDSGILNELGMDAIAAQDALRWAEEQGLSTENLYEEIAHRRGIGGTLAEGIHRGKGKGGKRRGGSHQAIAAAFGLAQEAPETDLFCRCLMEAISSAGQCMFTVNGILRRDGEKSELPVAQMLTLVTGREMNLECFLELGRRSLALEQQLNRKYESKKNDR